MSDILTTDDFAVVRDLLHTDETTVSDSLLSSFVFVETVEALVKQGVTDWATIKTAAGSDWMLLKSGTACLLAIRVAATRFSSSASYGGSFAVDGYSEGGVQVEWEAAIAKLKQMAAEAFSAISTVVHTVPTFMLATGPTSSGAGVPDDWEEWIDKLLPRLIDWIEENGEDDD